MNTTQPIPNGVRLAIVASLTASLDNLESLTQQAYDFLSAQRQFIGRGSRAGLVAYYQNLSCVTEQPAAALWKRYLIANEDIGRDVLRGMEDADYYFQRDWRQAFYTVTQAARNHGRAK